ncbi:MAG: RNA pseudouridine synthase [Myxococcaceae bacterium]
MHLVVLAQRGGWVAIDKPPGLLVIPGRTPDDQLCAKTLLEGQLKTRIWVCHRIDRETSGVVLFATDADAHRTASMAFEHGEAKKRYLALVEGRVEAPLEIDAPIAEGRKGKMRVAFPGEEGKPARTIVKPVKVFPGSNASLVECEPLTGRQHQIRVHLKSKGHPLLFDHHYGRKEPLTVAPGVTLARTPLHAAKLTLKDFEVEAPLAADLQRVIDALQ